MNCVGGVAEPRRVSFCDAAQAQAKSSVARGRRAQYNRVVLTIVARARTFVCCVCNVEWVA